ncbi:4-alpha-glucanotransferase [Guyparkeria hydrothermalis]|uniref:4-alpha-glucanotransferase n=1 Tax=Guyparkeria hydrothermalis TaxID=923 RepID=UPI002020AFCC|nr:4-alpha-glucanotransferase [Guyparkeria hydrothermalis]MCL7743986.1 4-alpha-glucanotransferase [Guyparkeria hydrothermalis]
MNDDLGHCEPPATRRRAGLLLPVASLSEPGFGRAARELIDFLVRSGLSVWQMLPLGPTHPDGSPYQCLSSFALEPSLLDERDLAADPAFAPGTPVAERRRGGGASPALYEGFIAFREREAEWLDDYCRFMVVRATQGGRSWFDWPSGLRDREASVMKAFVQEHAGSIEAAAFEQFLLDRQWKALRGQARENGICLFGDLPIFVAGDSADVWANRALFDLDVDGRPSVVAGVPPDYFSATGQRWGNPLFDFERMAEDDFAWWRSRLARHLELYDWVRIDHFRAFSAYWAIPAEDDDATSGRWVEAPGDDLLESLRRVGDSDLPLVAEDLGVITPEVTALRDRFGLPGMVVLQFAFDGSEGNPHRPDRHRPQSVVYTGTHDNDTTLGWWWSLDDAQRAGIRRELETVAGIDPATPMPDALVEVALGSRASLAILPVADLLNLGSEARINVPGTSEGNWTWRLPAGALDDEMAERTRIRLAAHDRLI